MILGHEAPPTPPICQNRKVVRISTRGSRIALISELNAAEMAAPASASLSGVAPPRPSDPTAYTNTAETAAPAIATQMKLVGELMPKNAMPVTTHSEAPVVTPRMPGSASGLRVTPCITAPDRPSAAPTSMASSVRGIRFSTAAWAMPSGVRSARRRCRARPTARVPNATEATPSRATTATVTSNHARRVATGRRVATSTGGDSRVRVEVTRPWPPASAMRSTYVVETPRDRERRRVGRGGQRASSRAERPPSRA